MKKTLVLMSASLVLIGTGCMNPGALNAFGDSFIRSHGAPGQNTYGYNTGYTKPDPDKDGSLFGKAGGGYTFRDSKGFPTRTTRPDGQGGYTFRDSKGFSTGTARPDGQGGYTFRDSKGFPTGTARPYPRRQPGLRLLPHH